MEEYRLSITTNRQVFIFIHTRIYSNGWKSAVKKIPFPPHVFKRLLPRGRCNKGSFDKPEMQVADYRHKLV